MPSGLTPTQLSIRGRAGGLALHSKVDSVQHLAPAREGFRNRFRDEVDPQRVLPEAERERRTDRAIRSYMQRLALKSSRARQRERP